MAAPKTNDLGARLIARIVRAYPSAVRDPLGDELLEVTLGRWRNARARGRFAGVRWWATEGVVLAWDAVMERWDRWSGRDPLRNRGAHGPERSWEGTMGDVKRLFRTMTRNFGFSASLIAVLTVALGLATGAFAFTDGILLEPLRYASSDRLVAVWAARPGEGLDRVPLTQWDVQQVMSRSDVFESVGGFTQQRSAMQLPDRVIEIGFGWLSSELHDVLDVQPILGRTYTEEERGELVALLDHGFWQRQFGGDPDILGQTIRIAQQSWTVIGVLPPNTPLELPSRGRVPQPVDVWSTMWVQGADPDATSAWIRTVARLAPGVTVERARAVLDQIADRSRTLFPEREEAGFGLTADRMRDDFTAGISRRLWLLFAGTVILLLAAVTNAGNLIVLHHERRRHRTAIRLAVGASSARLSRTACFEAALFAGIAAALALPFAQLVLTSLVSWTPADVPRLDVVRFDGRALLFLAVATAVTTTLVGALSVFWTRQIPVDAVLRQGRSRGGAWSGGRLVSAEVAFAVPLLVVGVLLGRSAAAMSQIDPGFDTEGAVTLRLALPNHEISRVELTAILEDFHDRLRAHPGVDLVGAANLIPLAGGAFTGPVATEEVELDAADVLEGDYRFTTYGYLEALGVELLEGAWPRSGDPERSVVVDESLAGRLWPDGQAIGQSIAARPLGDRRADFTVVGVVGSTRHETLREDGRPTVYFTSPGYTIPYMTTVVRGQVDAATLFPVARRFGAEAHPDFLVAEARGLEDVVASGTALARWLLTLVTALAAGACSITAIGLYAVVGQFVSGYRPALGVRRALGARPVHLVSLVARKIALIVTAGFGFGMVLAAVASTYLRSELVGIEPTDPVTWAVAVAAMVLLSAAAIALPTRGAMSVSPLDVLRSE